MIYVIPDIETDRQNGLRTVMTDYGIEKGHDISVIAPKGKLARYMAFNSMMNQTARAIGPSIGSTL